MLAGRLHASLVAEVLLLWPLVSHLPPPLLHRRNAPITPVQATRNGSDLWLSRWVSHTDPESPQQQDGSSWQGGGLLTTFCASVPVGLAVGTQVPPQAGCLPVPGFAPASRPPALPGSGSNSSSGQGEVSGHSAASLDPTICFYLSVLLAIAGANTLATLARAFSFAKGGLVAAQVRRQLAPARACAWSMQAGCSVAGGTLLAGPEGLALHMQRLLRCQLNDELCSRPIHSPCSPFLILPTTSLATHTKHTPSSHLLQRVHEQLLSAVLSLPLAFFDATPPGRVLNRFSSDTGEAGKGCQDGFSPLPFRPLLACMQARAGRAGAASRSCKVGEVSTGGPCTPCMPGKALRYMLWQHPRQEGAACRLQQTEVMAYDSMLAWADGLWCRDLQAPTAAAPTLFCPAATVDDSLPFILNILLANCASLAGVAVVLCLTQVQAVLPECTC